MEVPAAAAPILTAIVLLLVRVYLFYTFVYESRHKFSDIAKFAKGHGMPVAGAYVIASLEMLIALSMLTGFGAQYAAILLMLMMAGTTQMNIVKWKSPYRAQKGGWEYDLIQFLFAAVILAFGAGAYSL